MDPVSASSRSIEAVNTILQTTYQASIETAQKLMKVSVELSLGAELGKGAEIDITV